MSTRRPRSTTPTPTRPAPWVRFAFALLALAAPLAECPARAFDVRVALRNGEVVRGDELKTDEAAVEVVVRRRGIRIARRIPRDRILSIDDGTKVAAEPHARPAVPAPPPAPIAPPAFGLACPPPFPPYALPRMVVVGVRPDPLEAYAHRLPEAFPLGVPPNERGFALWLMREATARDALLPPPGIAPGRAGSGPNGRPAAPPLPGPSASLPIPSPAASPTGTVDRIVARATARPGGGNVDRDVLAVELAALDEAGRPVPAAGTLAVALHGRRQELVRAFETRFAAEVGEVVRLGDWTRRVTATTAPRWELPLRHPLPDHDPTVAPLGDVHVTLTVPGRGVFETVVTDVPLRRASLVREGRFVESGSPFAPHTRLDGRRRLAWPTVRSLSTVRPNGRVLTVQP